MKKLIILLLLASYFIVGLSSCTDNSRAKGWGGTTTTTLEDGKKLVNVTWKENNIWILTRPMTASDSAVTYSFKEESSFGLIEGEVIIVEVKNKQ